MARNLKSESGGEVERPKSPRGDQPQGEKSSPLFVASVEKAISVLFAFDGVDRKLTLNQIASRIDMHPSAVQRFLYTWHQLGFLTKDETSRQYAPTSRLLRLASTYLRGNELIERAMPHMVEASEKLGSSISLSELDGTDIIYISRVVRRHPSTQFLLGTRIPAFCTAGGRAMLAFSPDAPAILDASNIRSYTDYTITNRKDLDAALREVADAGFAISNQEYLEGDISVAAPVFDYAGNVVAAISGGFPSYQWTIERIRREIIPTLVEAASTIAGIHAMYYRSAATKV